MKTLRDLAFVAGLVSAVLRPAFAGNRFTVPSCPPVFEHEAVAANFRSTVRYQLVTDTNGFVISVAEDETTKSPPPFRPELEALSRCLRSWRLEPTTRYLAELQWGSGGPPPSWRVCRTDGGCLELKLVAPSPVPSEDKPCDCAALAAASVRCYRMFWPKFAAAKPATEEELNKLLDDMLGGFEDVQSDSADCNQDPSERCDVPCRQVLWRSFIDLARTSSTLHERWGAISVAFSAYMDTGAPDDVLAVLAQTAEDLLAHPRDSVSTAAVLRLMTFYRFPAEPTDSLLLKAMEGDSLLQRDLAFQRFVQFTRCPLPFRSNGGSEERAEQLAKIRRWWSAQSAPR